MVRAKSQYPEIYRRFGQLLAEERTSRGLSQSEVARRLGKPPSAVWKYENGELRLDVVEFLAFAKAVGFDPLDLMRRLAVQDEQSPDP
ncbi:putative transcriptional regulator [Magnetospirillum sp. XM-1]|uniref:helix-turn-helix domain-containing protein n=1 Tax=Magnetospirillum sp. XM-1 TaxID=1663591 RepID=UPI00073DE53E|nr:helix-turn-helix transcriptional regulator [Magnetospirillum sp. XM-1]CUW37721.1 putative transcriptional regulator [Magnetospirillum sp. XM-1]